MMISNFSLDVLILRVAAVLLALAIHEYAHAAVAVRLGDPGPKFDGRLTLNPLAHLDPVGTLMLFFFSFGWAKPVMVNPTRFKNPRRDMMWVALAGPVSNIVLAFALGPAGAVHPAADAVRRGAGHVDVFASGGAAQHLAGGVQHAAAAALGRLQSADGYLARDAMRTGTPGWKRTAPSFCCCWSSRACCLECCSRPTWRWRDWWWAECTKSV